MKPSELLSGVPQKVVIQGNQTRLVYIIANESVWYALEVIFVVGLALSVFQDKLLEKQA